MLELDWADLVPSIRVRDDGDRTSVHVPLIGMRLNYRLMDPVERVCLGHRAFGGDGAVYIDCLRAPKPGSKKCVRCSVHDLAFAANVHHAHTKDRRDIDLLFAKHLAQPNLLYLAAFRDGSIKVGTSTKHRGQQRLAEQGAWIARIVGEAVDGFVVREMEDLVTEFVGTSQAVSTRRKLAGLLRPQPDEYLSARLDEHTTKAVALIEGLNDDRLTPIDEEWIFSGRSNTVWDAPVAYPLALDRGSHDLTVVDACGRSVLLTRRNATGSTEPELFLADIGQLFGWKLELGHFKADEIAVQPALFG